jgi:hypothetical protein
VEAALVETREFESRATPGKKTGVLAIVEGLRFWVREDAINESGDFVDPAVSDCVRTDWNLIERGLDIFRVQKNTELNLVRFCVQLAV